MSDGHPHRRGAGIEMLPLSQPSPNDRQLRMESQVSLLEDENNGDEPRVSVHEDETHKHEFKKNKPQFAFSARKRPSILRNVWVEILCFSLATTSLVALIAILWKCDNKESPKWSLGHVGITLNAIISIVSTLFRGSLLMPVAQSISQLCWTRYTQPRPLRDICFFDSASRGPLGSVRLLVKLRFIHLASLGALITIAAMAIDTFLQQTVRYHSQPAVDRNGQALAAAAHSYPNIRFTGEAQFSYNVLPYNMKAAAYNGLLSSNLATISSPPFSCPTGNCTWDPFSTLAISSQCINITDQVSLNCTNSEISGELIELCTLIAPNDSGLQQLLNGSSSPHDAFNIEAGAVESYLPVLESYANMTGFLSLTQWVKAHIGSTSNSQITPNTTFEAGRCFFYFSVMEVQAQVINGVYSEEVLQEYTQVQNRSTTPTFTFNGTDFFFIDPFTYNFNETLIYKPEFAKAPPNNNDTFTVSYNTFEELGSLIWASDFLSGNVGTGFSSGAQGTNPNVLLMWETDNITRAMQNLAQYMTIQMRSIDLENSQGEQGNTTFFAPHQAVRGTVWTQKQFVTVEWAWLTLPAILLVLAIFLFVATCLKTRASRVGLWQSSPLTLFFHGKLSSELGSLRLTELNTAEKMGNAAEGFRAQITKEIDGAIEVYR